MKIHIPNCPECGSVAAGTLERLRAIAELDEVKKGEFQYSGHTEHMPDTQHSVTDGDGLYTLVCLHGHQWQSQIDDYKGLP